LLVAHLEAADRACPDVATGKGRLVDDQQGVGVVAIAGPRALDEAVVEVVVDGARQHAVEPEDVGLLVVLVLVPRPARDLDHDLDDFGERAGRLHPISLVATNHGLVATNHGLVATNDGLVATNHGAARSVPGKAEPSTGASALPVRERGAQATT